MDSPPLEGDSAKKNNISTFHASLSISFALIALGVVGVCLYVGITDTKEAIYFAYGGTVFLVVLVIQGLNFGTIIYSNSRLNYNSKHVLRAVVYGVSGLLGYNLYLSELYRNGLKQESEDLAWLPPIAATATQDKRTRSRLTLISLVIGLTILLWQIFREGMGSVLSSRKSIEALGFFVLLLLSAIYIDYRHHLQQSGRVNTLEKQISSWWLLLVVLLGVVVIWLGVSIVKRF